MANPISHTLLSISSLMMVSDLLQGGILTVLLFIISSIDIKKRIIPDTLCVLMSLTGFICFEPVNLFGIFCAAPFLITALACGGMGGGDIKLMASSGIVLGFWGGIFAMVIGLFAMLFFYLLLKIITKVQGRNCPKVFPLAPFLTVGILTAYYLNLTGGIHTWLF